MAEIGAFHGERILTLFSGCKIRRQQRPLVHVHVRERIVGDDELRVEQKARVLAAVDRSIAGLRDR
jgi:hypothetical protein